MLDLNPNKYNLKFLVVDNLLNDMLQNAFISSYYLIIID